jgi:hypothetical protein
MRPINETPGWIIYLLIARLWLGYSMIMAGKFSIDHLIFRKKAAIQ